MKMTTAEKIQDIMDRITRTIDPVEYEDLTKEEQRLYKHESRRLAGQGSLLSIRGFNLFAQVVPFDKAVRNAIRSNINRDNTIGSFVKWSW